MRLATHHISVFRRTLSESFQLIFFQFKVWYELRRVICLLYQRRLSQQFAVSLYIIPSVPLSRFSRDYQMLGQVQLNVWRQFDSNVVNGYCCNIAAACAGQ